MAETVKGKLQELIDNSHSAIQTDCTFHDGKTVTGNGVDYPINKHTSLNIFITGTSSTRTITFKGVDINGNLHDLIGFKVGDLTYTGAISTTGSSESWYFDEIQNFKYVRFPITVITGGNVTVKGVMT